MSSRQATAIILIPTEKIDLTESALSLQKRGSAFSCKERLNMKRKLICSILIPAMLLCGCQSPPAECDVTEQTESQTTESNAEKKTLTELVPDREDVGTESDSGAAETSAAISDAAKDIQRADADSLGDEPFAEYSLPAAASGEFVTGDYLPRDDS